MSTRKSRQYRGQRCLNCETALDISEKYCHQCGQLNSTKKLTIGDFFEEFLSNFYAYDSRLRNSIVSIFTKPGILAKEFNEGKRQKYANPFRLFLSVSIVLFITMGIDNNEIGLPEEKSKKEIDEDKINQKKADSLAFNLLGTDVTINGNAKKDTVELHKDSIYTKKEIYEKDNKLVNTITSFRNFYIKNSEKSTEESLKELGFENSFLNRLLFNKAKTFQSNDINNEIKNYFLQKLPILIFLMLPLITLMFWLIFYSKKINYTEHLVFTYTFYTFLFLCMILFSVLDYLHTELGVPLALICFLGVFPFYLYKSLRNFYKLSRWKTIFKFVLLNLLFFPLALVSGIFIFFLSVLFF